MPGRAQRRRRNPALGRRRTGFTLVELMLVVTIMGILASMAVPSFKRSMQQSRADVAGANLRAIWSAERAYWLDNHTYTTNLSVLETLGLVDPSIVSGGANYTYAVTAADGTSFTATATRTGSTVWSGTYTIDETGVLTGVVTATGQPDIEPGFD